MLVIGIFMIVPMLILLAFSFLEADPYGGVEPVFSTEAYVQTLFEIDFDDTISFNPCLLYTSPSPRDQRGSRMPSSA